MFTMHYPTISPQTVGHEGVSKQIKSVNSNKASGLDELPPWIYHGSMLSLNNHMMRELFLTTGEKPPYLGHSKKNTLLFGGEN